MVRRCDRIVVSVRIPHVNLSLDEEGFVVVAKRLKDLRSCCATLLTPLVVGYAFVVRFFAAYYSIFGLIDAIVVRPKPHW